MAEKKRKIVDDDLFARTTSEQTPATSERFDLDKGPTVATGLGIRTGEKEAIAAISKELGIKPNAFVRFCIRYVLKEYLAGRLDLIKWVEIPPEPERKIRMP
jgi:hypothetical protein